MMWKHRSNGQGALGLVLLVAISFGCLVQASHDQEEQGDSEGTYLEFVERTSNYRIMRRCDDCNSDAIDLSANPVPFGEYYHLVAHIATNGLVSFGTAFTSFVPVPFSNESSLGSFVAAPYWADIDNSFTGEIWYEPHTAGSGENSTESNALLEEVSAFIRVRQGVPSFNGSWMLVATWNESFPFDFEFNNVSEHNTFQAIVITNGTKTYAVFTYHCDDINWANGNSTVIGFNAGGTSYENHPFSGTPDASDIDCESYPPSLWNNIVYDVNPLGSNTSIIPPSAGSCLAAGFTECCVGELTSCLGTPTFDCYCDRNCYSLDDCCDDIDEICPGPTELQPGNDTFLVVASALQVLHISIDGSTFGNLVPQSGFTFYLAVDYDYRQNYIYFSEFLFTATIWRVAFNGSSQEIIFSSSSKSIEDLAVDWIANNLYWTDTLNRKLEVLDIDSTHIFEVVDTGLHTAPRAIVVDPSTRYMYWSDWGEPAKIERASMDGSDRRVLHNTGMTWPNGLAIDYQLQRLYWTDAFTDRIEYSSVDGTGREILLTSAHGLQHPFGITISGDQIYWTDVTNASIFTAHKQAASNILRVYEGFLIIPAGIEAVNPNRQSTNITNYCEGNTCSHLCLLSASSPANYTCACPEGSSLMEDGVSCTEVSNVTATPLLSGSCAAAGYSDCCIGGYCAGYPANCFCDPDCELSGFCCDDFRTICLRPTTESNETTTTPIEPTTLAPLATTAAPKPPSEQVYLEFVERTSNYRIMPRCDDCNSDAIDLSANPVPFGEYYHLVAHVATNGLVSFGNTFTSFLPVLFSNESSPTIAASFIAAPYWADIDNRFTGEIWYETHTAGSGENSTESNALLEEVSAFIRVRQGVPSFNGSWMLVATWNESFPISIRNVSELEHNTFQAIVITNGTKTYAVFTYHCDDINWASPRNDTVIGFNAGGTSYKNHPLSGTPDASDIDCESYPPSLWNNVVYDVNPLGSNETNTAPTGGSCLAAGYRECCSDLLCLGAPTFDCFCDPGCHRFGDCCYDIDQTCPSSTPQGNETFLIVANRITVYRMSIDGTFAGTATPLNFSTSYVGIDYHYRQQYMYFSDVLGAGIQRLEFNGTIPELVVNTPLQSIEDLAVDWIANNLYWTDTLGRKVEVYNLDSKHTTMLLQSDVHSAPKAIVVDPNTRYMYWSDWGEPAKIERASMDGSDRIVLHDTGLTWPNGLAIDYQLQRLYWADAFIDRIEYSSVDGTGREILLTVASGLHHPFAITISGDQVYWTDWANLTVYTAHKQAATTILPVFSGFLLRPNGIEAVDPKRQWTNITNYCEGSPCSHLCLLSASSPTNYTCACPEGSSLMEDGVSCTEVSNVTTTPPQRGSCAAAGFTDCCEGGYCAGFPANCFCESDCETFRDCCDDFRTICAAPTTAPSPITTTSIQPTTAPSSVPSTTTESPTAQGNYLKFVERTSNYHIMRRCDDCNSDAIDLSTNPVPFGEYYHLVAHVATNGLVSFGNTFTFFTPILFSNETSSAAFVAAPYWADIDNSFAGEIWYETHTAKNSTESLEKVSAFIRAQQGVPLFNGSWMLVATWNESFPFSIGFSNVSEHNTFQAIVITNGTKTYAVFTYHCDDINWANGNFTVIGFNAGGTSYENHPFSGTPDASNIDCDSYPPSLWNNIVYDVNPLGSNSSILPPLEGSCLDAGYTECCDDGICLGVSTFTCYCDSTCYGFGDCCSDIEEICPRSSLVGNGTFLIVANSLTIFKISTDGSSSMPLLPVSVNTHYLALDFDYRSQYVYYSDLTGQGLIGRVGFNGSTPETVVVTGIGLEFIEDLAMDWIANNLYWTDTLNRRLEVLDIDSEYKTVLLRTGAHSAPKAIVVDPNTRYMYWSDWGEPAKIERASMDGSDQIVLHDTGLTWPNGLAIDYQLQRLYWADAFTDRIEYSSVDGTGREILLTVASGLHHPFAIAISGDQVYWTDWANFTVYTAHKQAAIAPLPVYSNFLVPPNGIEAVDPNRQQTDITNYCEGNTCSHLCLLSASSPTNYTCACPEGSSLMEDGVSCTEVTNVTTIPPQRGSCAAAGYTDCCTGGYCAGSPATCYCEPDCDFFGDCCDDFRTICLPPSNSFIPLSTPTVSATTVMSTSLRPTPTTEVKTSPTSVTPTPSVKTPPIIPTSATPTTTTGEPTIAIFSPRRINGGIVAGALIVVILVLILIAVIILGVVWIVKKKKIKEVQAYGLFESDTESDAGSTFGELKPRLDSYEQKEKLRKEAVSYEAGNEKLHFNLKPNPFTPLEPDDAV